MFNVIPKRYPPQFQLVSLFSDGLIESCFPAICHSLEEAVKKQAKFAVGAVIIVATLGWLGWVGTRESKTYYHTIAELSTPKASEARQRMRVGGTVRPGSIARLTGRVDFVLEGEGKALAVSYAGSDPLPDTFVDGSQALVEGKLASNGTFVADRVQAKCASKYETAPGQQKPGYDNSGNAPNKKT